MNQNDEILARLGALEEEVFLLRSRSRIENLVSKYQHLYMAAEGDRILEECWSKDEMITMEVGPSGIYIGKQSLGNYYHNEKRPGRMHVYTLSTPHIRVKSDKTAAGIWFLIGTDTDAGQLREGSTFTEEEKKLLTMCDDDKKRYRADWIWQKFAADFVYEDDAWKIHDLHIYEIFRCPFDTDWVKYSVLRQETDGYLCDDIFTPEIEPEVPEGFPREYLPQVASSTHWQYAIDSIVPLMPEVPDED